MLPDRYYDADVHEGPKLRRLYFYASVEGLTDPEYGYTEEHSWVDQEYERVIHKIRGRSLAQPSGFEAVDGADVTVSEPREISHEEIDRLNPGVNLYVIKAIALAKREIGEAIHPIKVIWHWQTRDEAEDEAAVYLELADDTGRKGQGFGRQELRDEITMRERISRLYQDLLAFGSRTLILGLLRTKAGAGKD